MRQQTRRALGRLVSALGVVAVIVVLNYGRMALGTVPTFVVAFVLATVVGTLGVRRQVVRDRQRRKPGV